MKASITALVENTANRVGLTAEHGLCFHIETDGGDLLFDTGQGRALLPNADELEVDLGRLDRVVLSHGHFDHTGGLVGLLDRIGEREVLAHADALRPKLAVQKGREREIGLPAPVEELERAGARFVGCAGPVEAIPGVTATGPVPRVTDFEPVSPRFRVRSNGTLAQDEILDDQALVVHTSAGPYVVLGCAHAGLINTLLYASELAGTRQLAGVVGGTHLVDADEARLERTVQELGQFDLAQVAPCHCTGFRGQVALWQAFGDRFALTTVGDRLELT